MNNYLEAEQLVKTIIFDLDDTLLWDKQSVATAFKKTCEYAATKYDLDSQALEDAVRNEAKKLYATYETYDYTKMIGINPFEGLWGTFDDEGESFQKMKGIVPTYQREAWTNGLLALGVDDKEFGQELAKRFPEERKKSPFVYEETFEVLDQLKGNYDLVLLTNGSPSLQQTKLTITPEIAPYFSRIVVSGAFGKGKPDPSIFEHVLEKCGISPKEALMVGDNLMTDILGASRVGIPSVWINRENTPEHDDVKATYEIDNLKQLFEVIEQA